MGRGVPSCAVPLPPLARLTSEGAKRTSWVMLSATCAPTPLPSDLPFMTSGHSPSPSAVSPLPPTPVQHSPLADEYSRIVQTVTQSLRFMENVLGLHPGEIEWVEFFASHEALHLTYESAQTKRVDHREGWYNLAAHLPWVGMRTADPDGAHVEYLRGIRNPVGVKVGANTTADRLARLVEVLDPSAEAGRLTLIHRLGRGVIGEKLSGLIQAVKRTGRTVLWICDPMHGNTRTTRQGRKTRYFEDVLGELEMAFDIHAVEGSTLGGVHFELTGEDVTECVGGARGLREEDLGERYQTEVDPRLNYEQALEMALLLARKMMAGKKAAALSQTL